MSLFLNSQTGVKNSKSESGFMLNLNISPAFLYCLEYGEFEFIIFTVWISMKKKKLQTNICISRIHLLILKLNVSLV